MAETTRVMQKEAYAGWVSPQTFKMPTIAGDRRVDKASILSEAKLITFAGQQRVPAELAGGKVGFDPTRWFENYEARTKQPERSRSPKPGESLSVNDLSVNVRNPELFSYSEDSFQRRLTSDDVWEHGRLQGEFDRAIGRKYSSKDMLTRSYNPVTDRWHIEILRREGDKAGESGFRNEIRKNIRANLRERLQVDENIVRYRIEGGELYSEDFPNEPFNDVMQRGADYRFAHGTKEAEREGQKGELGGWATIRAIVTDPKTPVGTKLTYFSPPGRVTDTPYDRQLVDELELREDVNGRYLHVSRKIVDFTDQDYIKAALELDKRFFEGYDQRSLDAWFLSHPVKDHLPSIETKGRMNSATFDSIYESPMLQGIINKYITTVFAKNANWLDIAVLVNAIYNQVDVDETSILQGNISERPLFISQDAVEAAVAQLGWQTPEEKGGAGCPTSMGYSLSNSFAPSIMNSVSGYGRLSFGGNNTGGGEYCPEIKCKYCSWIANESEAKAVQSGSLTKCPNPECGWVPGGPAPEKMEVKEALV